MKLNNATTAKPATATAIPALLLMWLPLTVPVKSGSLSSAIKKTAKK